MKIRDANIIIVPGYKNSSEDHWQSRWQEKIPSASRVEQTEWHKPVREHWVEAVCEHVLAQDNKPVVLVAHSLGVAVAVHALLEHEDVAAKVAGAFLVAPPDVENPKIRPKHLMTFGPYPTGPLPCPSYVIGSRNDPFSSYQKMQDAAGDWGSFFVDAGEYGHINEESGHGPWPEGLLVFAEFMKRL